MADLIFMQYAEVGDGSATLEGYEGWIAVESLAINMNRNISPPSGSGQSWSASRVNFGTIEIAKAFDYSSVHFQKAAIMGKVPDPNTGVTTGEANIHILGGSEGTTKLITYKLTDPAVTNYTISGQNAEGANPYESISIVFGKIEIRDEAQAVTVTYDLTTGAEG